ncbi:MAG: hypothetical protein MUP45_04525 [Candidatus Marinimicrobia bacterium]|nr:hypothetical protein [Candidatus Neomarinimicrobiota bacterium]
MKKPLTVLMCDKPDLFDLYLKTHDFALVIESDPERIDYAKLGFRSKRVLYRLARIFMEKGISFVPMMDQHVLYFDRKKVNIATFLAFLPDRLAEAGYPVLIAKHYNKRLAEFED